MNAVLEFVKHLDTGTWSGWVLVAMGFGWIVTQWMKDRKLSSEERLAAREGFTAQVALLSAQLKDAREENRQVMDDNHELRAELDRTRKQCYEETEQLRSMLIENREETEGCKRKIATLAYELAKLKGYDG